MERPDPADDLEEEGIPEVEELPPGLEGTGGDYEAVPAPRDRPQASLDWGITEDEERRGEPLEVRRRRELPDRVKADPVVVPRLVEEEELGDEFAELTDDDTGLSAEEAAMHFEEPR
jgi:hypothetical protein